MSYKPEPFDCGIVNFVLCSFPTGQATITPAGMTIMPSSHLYGHAGLLQSPMPILSTTADTNGGQIVTAGIAPPTGYAGMYHLQCVPINCLQFVKCLCGFWNKALIVST